MIMILPIITAVLTYLDAAKFWVGLATAFFFIYQLVTWFRDIRVKDLKNLQENALCNQEQMAKQTIFLGDIHTGVRTNHQEITRQTDILQRGFDSLIAIQKEGVRDLRDDFKTFFSFARPMMTSVASSPVYKHKTPVRRSTKRKEKAKVRKKSFCCKK